MAVLPVIPATAAMPTATRETRRDSEQGSCTRSGCLVAADLLSHSPRSVQGPRAQLCPKHPLILHTSCQGALGRGSSALTVNTAWP